MSVPAPLFFAMFAVVAFLIGLSKGGLGGTLGGLATPLMALVMPPDQVIGLLLPILMFADVFAVALHWGRWDRRLALRLIPSAVVGVTAGTVFITNAPTRSLRLALGVIVLLFAVYKVLESRLLAWLRYRPQPWHGLVAGTVAGFSSALAHTGGPPVSIYLLLQDVTPRVFIATSALFFMLLNWIKVPYYLYAGLFDLQRLWQVAGLMFLVPLGVWIGRWLGNRISKPAFDRLILALIAGSGLLLILT